LLTDYRSQRKRGGSFQKELNDATSGVELKTAAIDYLFAALKEVKGTLAKPPGQYS
jgi:hypothetical protein